ncbi:MAG: hypothetical protein ABMA25_13240 [Ilumatobacteraceae bacterium]
MAHNPDHHDLVTTLVRNVEQEVNEAVYGPDTRRVYVDDQLLKRFSVRTIGLQRRCGTERCTAESLASILTVPDVTRLLDAERGLLIAALSIDAVARRRELSLNVEALLDLRHPACQHLLHGIRLMRSGDRHSARRHVTSAIRAAATDYRDPRTQPTRSTSDTHRRRVSDELDEHLHARTGVVAEHLTSLRCDAGHEYGIYVVTGEPTRLANALRYADGHFLALNPELQEPMPPDSIIDLTQSAAA